VDALVTDYEAAWSEDADLVSHAVEHLEVSRRRVAGGGAAHSMRFATADITLAAAESAAAERALRNERYSVYLLS
jgi:hypothetical protein